MLLISELDDIITRKIPQTKSKTFSYVVRKNIEYNIRYLEFLAENFPRQHWVEQSLIIKNFLIIVFSIIESILSYELKTQNLIPKDEWELVSSMKANPKIISNQTLITETFVYRKLENPIDKKLSFKQKLRIAQNKKIFGKNPDVYRILCGLKKLRDTVHLHFIDEFKETDYNRFSYEQFVYTKTFFLQFLRFYFGITPQEEIKYFKFLL